MVCKKGDKVRNYKPVDIVVWQHNTGRYMEPYTEVGLIRSLCGISCIAAGIATWLIPFTTVPLIGLGCWLLGYDSRIIIKKTVYKAKLLCDWLYCNRTPKRLVKTIKNRIMCVFFNRSAKRLGSTIKNRVMGWN